MCQSPTVLLMGFLSRVIGWFGTGFVGRPIRRFFDLRGEIIRQTARYGNVGARFQQVQPDRNQFEPIEMSEEAEQRLREAEQTFRDLAADMMSFALNERLAVWLLRLVRYNPMKISAALNGVSSAIGTKGHLRRQRKHELETLLRF